MTSTVARPRNGLRLVGREKVAELLSSYDWTDRPDLAQRFSDAMSVPSRSRCLELVTGEVLLVGPQSDYLRIFRNERTLLVHFQKVVRNRDKVPRTD